MQNPSKIVLPVALALLMLATRSDHFGSSLHLPDASLAVFFLAGLYWRGRFAFPLLLAEAALIDYIAIAHFGVSDFCVSPAYAFLIPAYAAPWAAGAWLRHRIEWNGQALLPVAGSLLAGTSLAFLFSNGSFYGLSGRFSDLSWGAFIEQAAHYFPSYLAGPFLYVTLAAAVYGLIHTVQSLYTLPGHKADS